MPETKTLERAHKDAEEGKSSGTQAGEFVREEIHHIRQGKHGARNTKQAIAIGLSKARRAGVDLQPPAAGRTSAQTRKSAERAYEKGQSHENGVSPTRTRATRAALEREGHSAASKSNLARQAHAAAGRRSGKDRSNSARKAAATRKREARTEAP